MGDDQNRRAEHEIGPAISFNLGIDRDDPGLGAQNDQRPVQGKNQNRAQAGKDFTSNLALRRRVGSDLPRTKPCGQHQVHCQVDAACADEIAQKIRCKNAGEYSGKMAEKTWLRHDDLLFGYAHDHMGRWGMAARANFGNSAANSGISPTFSESTRRTRLTGSPV